MTDDAALLSRRALLAAGVGGLALAAGCSSPARKKSHDPDEVAILAARASELALLQTYADGTEQHAAHLAHLRALGGAVPSPTPPASPSTNNAANEAATVAPLMDAARRAQRGETAALLASIAASHVVMSGSRTG